MVKDHSDSESANLLPPHGRLFPGYILGQKLFYMHHPTERITHTMTFVTPVVEHRLKRETGQWVHHKRSIRRPIVPCAKALITELHLAPPQYRICIYFGGAKKGGGVDLHLGRGQEDGIAMKGAQSNVKWGGGDGGGTMVGDGGVPRWGAMV